MTKAEAITELVRIWHSPHLDLILKARLGEVIEALKENDRSDSLVTDSSDDCKKSESKLDLISRQDAIEALLKAFSDSETVRVESGAYWHHGTVLQILKSRPSAEPPVLTCNGCRHVGTYDTDFPCSVCIRREKDYYEQER